ncbi:MAG: class I SAM-dependent methyltransferase, partial [Desulfomonile tiedjei]|nr:class I SAM-dependent methyltransferase [Desulfomonile tiedjei]
LEMYIPLVGEFAWHSLTNDTTIDSISSDHFQRVIACIDRWSEKSPETILEIGAYAHSTGHLLQRKYDAEVTLFDLSAATLRLGSSRLGERNSQVELVAGDFHHLPFSSKYFDVVYVFAALHHARDYQQVIREIERVLAPNGLLLVFQEPFKRGACLYKFHTNRPDKFTPFEKALEAEGVITTVSEPSPGSRDEILFGMIENQKIPLQDFLNTLSESCDPLEIIPHYGGKVGEVGKQWLEWGRERRSATDLSQQMQVDFNHRLNRVRPSFDRIAKGLGFNLPDEKELSDLFTSLARDIIALPADHEGREYQVQAAQVFGGVLTFVGRKRGSEAAIASGGSGPAKYLARYPVESGVRIAFPNDSAKLLRQERSCLPLLETESASAVQAIFPPPAWTFTKQENGFHALTLRQRSGEIILPKVGKPLLLVLRINFVLPPPPANPYCLKIVHAAKEFSYPVFQEEAILFREIIGDVGDGQLVRVSIEGLQEFSEPSPDGLVKVYYAGAFPLRD